jgi:hypothetical protein
MPEPNILVIAVDGLRGSALGAYGNTSFATPSLDELAAESLVCDWCFGEAVDLLSIYRALWRSETSLIESLTNRGYETTLIADDAAIADFDGAGDFQDRVILPDVGAARAADATDTAIGRVFAAASESLEVGATHPRMIWLHSRGMYGPWDAPLELQEELLARDEGDPPPENVVEPPDLWLDGAGDPDAAFRWSCAYAAQVMILDKCLAGLVHSVASSDGQEWLIVLMGLRGFPLGEHGRIGGVDGRLYAEQLHVPLLWRIPGGKSKLERSQRLMSLADFPAGLLGALDGKLCSFERDALQAVGPMGVRAIRTADWCLRCEPPASESPTADEIRCQLFVRPDDRWEANDVAGLCPDVVESLLARIAGVPTR